MSPLPGDHLEEATHFVTNHRILAIHRPTNGMSGGPHLPTSHLEVAVLPEEAIPEGMALEAMEAVVTATPLEERDNLLAEAPTELYGNSRPLSREWPTFKSVS